MTVALRAYYPDADEESRINARAEKCGDEMERFKPRILGDLGKVRANPEDREGNRTIMLALASEINRRLHPHTACGPSCNGCCSQAVPLNRAQAERIAKRTGRSLNAAAGISPSEAMVEHIEQAVAHYFGKPCPFLTDTGTCGCYDERPMACRLHHSLADDASPCDTSNGIHAVPVYPLTEFDLIYCANDFADDWADIREWFPA